MDITNIPIRDIYSFLLSHDIILPSGPDKMAQAYHMANEIIKGLILRIYDDHQIVDKTSAILNLLLIGILELF